jgi:hypothetical protein
MKIDELATGDLIEFYWFDILVDEVGDPVKARLLKRKQYGLFLDNRIDPTSGIQIMVTASGVDIDEDAQPQSGWQATPVHLITDIRRIRKAARARARTGRKTHEPNHNTRKAASADGAGRRDRDPADAGPGEVEAVPGLQRG